MLPTVLESFGCDTSIGESLAQRGLHHPRACGRALKHDLDLPGQAVQHLSGIRIKVMRVGELRAETRHQCSERFF
jgi:hypothetical protein